MNTYYRYYDSLEILGNHGSYWVFGEHKINIRGQTGIIFYQLPFYIQLGVSAKPVRAIIGVGLVGF